MLSKQAAYFRDALRLELCTVEDVVQWSDNLVAELPEPPNELLELSAMQGSTPAAVAGKLQELSYDWSTIQMLPDLAAAAHRRLVADRSFGPKFAQALAHLARDLRYPDVLQPAVGLNEDYCLAVEGINGFEPTVYNDLLSFTAGLGHVAR